MIKKGFFQRECAFNYVAMSAFTSCPFWQQLWHRDSSFVCLFFSCSSIEVHESQYDFKMFFRVFLSGCTLQRWYSRRIHGSIYVTLQMRSMFAMHHISVESFWTCRQQWQFRVSCNTATSCRFNGFSRWCRDAFSLKSVHLKSARLAPIWNQFDLKSVVRSGIQNDVYKCGLAAVCVLLFWSAKLFKHAAQKVHKVCD